MGVVYNSVVSDHGTDVLGAAGPVLFVAVHFTVLPPARRAVNTYDDRTLRLGWFSLGDLIDIGDGATEFWRAPIWCDFPNTLWTPDPSSQSSNALGLFATRIRWDFGTGGSAHVYAFD